MYHLLTIMFRKLFNFFKQIVPRKQDMKQVNAQGVLLNRQQRRQLQFRSGKIKNNRKMTKGRKVLKDLFNPTIQKIKLEDGSIKTIYHEPKQYLFNR